MVPSPSGSSKNLATGEVNMLLAFSTRYHVTNPCDRPRSPASGRQAALRRAVLRADEPSKARGELLEDGRPVDHVRRDLQNTESGFLTRTP